MRQRHVETWQVGGEPPGDRGGPVAPPIDDYAIIGDGRSCALVSREGSIDWLCWPRFDSPSVFAALLDTERGGYFRVSPSEPLQVHREYIGTSNVLRTRFVCRTGTAVLVDLMPVATEEEKRSLILPEHEVLRHVVCEAGVVEIGVDVLPRPLYGGASALLRDAGMLGIRFELGRSAYILRSDRPLLVGESRVRAQVRLAAGESATFSLVYNEEAPAVLVPFGARTTRTIERSVRFWHDWVARTQYHGPYQEAVLRSALALKLLAYAPSGAIVAAPTTSLPERPGGDWNWDYRYCWLRDASLTVRAFAQIGLFEEADAFVSWLLHTTRLTLPELHIAYDVFGKRVPKERVLPLRGYRGARPVRLGNGARDQIQLDVYGEVIDAVTQLVRAGRPIDKEEAKLLCGLGRYVCQHWREPDHGIWELRRAPAPHTHSRLLCWVALDRLIELHGRGALPSFDADGAAHERERIRADIYQNAWSGTIGAYTQELRGASLDASVLLLGWYGFEPAGSARIRSTLATLDRGLGQDGLLRRFASPAEDPEGAFGVCSFWAAEVVARGAGSVAEARRRFERAARCANDLGLLAEEFEPATDTALGNFPQGFTHIGLINAALSIADREREERK